MYPLLKSKRYFFLGLLLAALTFGLDQWSKAFVVGHWLTPEHPTIEIAPFFNLVVVWNYGISFGMLAAQRQPMLLTIVSVAIVLVLLVWLYRNASLATACALGAIIGGAAGNMADRLQFHAVIDFLDFHIVSYHWPAFNIADSAIFIGVVLLCAGSMLNPHHSP